MKSLIARIVLAAVILTVTACASVRQASPDRDAEAKRYDTHPGGSTLYVFRNDFADIMTTQNDVVLYMDDRIVGQVLPGGYFRIDARPGEHRLHGIAHDQGAMKITTRAGETHFVSLIVVAGNSVFKQVEPEAAKREIAKCCVLMENWAPGQRPLLR